MSRKYADQQQGRRTEFQEENKEGKEGEKKVMLSTMSYCDKQEGSYTRECSRDPGGSGKKLR